jgi:hypothetical protein
MKYKALVLTYYSPTYFDHYGNRREVGELYLRKDSRHETRANSQDVVNIPKDNIDSTRMRISGYDPKRDQLSKNLSN